ncbi:MAG: hypothetical protein E7604_01475 [Ruminococcaceae bacterium]|nr:hypothetical protein [Oscillospiraceae bacterium]
MSRCKQWISFAALWLAAAVLVIGSAIMPRVLAVKPEVPTLFYNDTVWVMDDYYPALGYTIGAMKDFWIPLSFYEDIEGMRVRRGTAKNNTVFIIQDTVTEKYLSFNLNDSTYAQTERSTLILLHTMLYSRERYLPMRDMCAYFGWTFEISADFNTVRICDGGQKKTFEELLSVYMPPPVTETEPETTVQTIPVTEPPVTGPVVTEPPVTEPPVTEPPVTEPPVREPDIYRASSVYLTFEDIEDTHTPVLLDTLRTFGAHAVFFVTGEQLTQYTDTVLRILAEGHTLGLHGMTADEYALRDTADLLAALEEENELLYALVRRKTRLVRLPEGSHSGRLYLSEQQKETLAQHGYVLWDWNISAMDHDLSYHADAVLAKIDAALLTSYYPVIRMHCTDTAAQVLPVLLQRLSDAGVVSQIITEATVPVVFP